MCPTALAACDPTTLAACDPTALAACGPPAPPAASAPVEYGAAVERYLAQAPLCPASRRVYRISLTAWAWPLVGKRIPTARARRLAPAPMVPLAALDEPKAGRRLAVALADRLADAGQRTVNREVSALRSATTWWREQGWIRSDPAGHLRHRAGPPPRSGSPRLSPAQIGALFHTTTNLREHAFWAVLADTGVAAQDVLGLDVKALDLARHRGRIGESPSHGLGGAPIWIHWSPATSDLLRWLTAGRIEGPVFLTGRRAPAGADSADVCPLTGRARLSYRRAAEIFADATRPLDPAGKGWTLSRLRPAAPPPRH